MAAYLLHLHKSELVNVNYRYVGAFRLRIVVTAPVGSLADPNVFLYDRLPINPYNGDIVDLYTGVASAVDLADYPVGAPDPTKDFPFFRLDTIELDLRSVTLADQLWSVTKIQIAHLLRVMEIMADKMAITEEVVIGNEGDTNVSDVSSISS